jgi:thiamine pyrophosphokinase
MTRNSLYIIIVLVLLNSCSKSDSKNCASLSLKGDVLASDPCKPSGSILITGLSANGLQYKIDNQNWQTASTFSNVSAGNHKITVVTKDGCEDTLYQMPY